jgi:hypothetical protein
MVADRGQLSAAKVEADTIERDVAQMSPKVATNVATGSAATKALRPGRREGTRDGQNGVK